MPDLARWQQKQVRAAVARGLNPLDAVAAAKAFLAMLPPGADPDTYILPEWALVQDITRPNYRTDANAAWYGQAGRYAALLDAS